MALIPSKLIGQIAHLGHVASGLSTIASTVVGGETAPTGGGFFERIARMIPAVLTKDDEIRFELLLQELDGLKDVEGDDFYRTRPRAILIQFMQWHFKKRCMGEMAVSFWYQNSFRKFIVDLDSKGESENGIKFLTWMVKTILVEGDGDIEVGFDRLASQLEHVPHVPEGAARYIERAQEILDKGIESTHRGYREARVGIRRHRKDMEACVREIESRPKSFLDWLIK